MLVPSSLEASGRAVHIQSPQRNESDAESVSHLSLEVSVNVVCFDEDAGLLASLLRSVLLLTLVLF